MISLNQIPYSIKLTSSAYDVPDAVFLRASQVIIEEEYSSSTNLLSMIPSKRSEIHLTYSTATERKLDALRGAQVTPSFTAAELTLDELPQSNKKS
jgi:hypothetical protein